MTDIKIEDLTPGTVVELKASKVRAVKDTGFVVLENDGGSGTFTVHWARIARIISRPETDADKIARLERELAERDARIAELTASKAEPTTPVWSDPIEGPPPKGLPGGSYQTKLSEHGGWSEWHCLSDHFSNVKGWMRHRIAMKTPIKWEGGECPLPGKWEMKIDGFTFGFGLPVAADMIDWSKPFTFTLTSTGGGNG